MATSDDDLPPTLEAFRASLIDDVYVPADFLPWLEIEQEVQASAPGIARLAALAERNNGPVDDVELAGALVAEESVFSVVMRLLATPGGVGFRDGRRLPDHPPRDLSEASAAAQLLLDLGLGRLLSDGADLTDMLRVSLIGADARRRGYRRRNTLAARFDALVATAVAEASATLGQTVVLAGPQNLPQAAARRVDRVLYVEGKPVAAIATVFEGITGGRQTASLVTFADVQAELDTVPVSLILIADGRGVKAVSPRRLAAIWDQIGAILTISQAESGLLADTIASLVRTGGFVRSAQVPVARLIAATLAEQTSISVEDLPVSPDAASLALARYQADHPDDALTLNAREGRLSWERADKILRVDELRRAFDPAAALNSLAALMGSTEQSTIAPGDSRWAVLVSPPPNPLLPRLIYAAAQTSEATADTVREISLHSREQAPESAIAFLLAPASRPWLDDPDRELTMRTTSTSVIVLDPQALRDIASAAEPPQQALAAHVLRQADLTKASPFVHSGVTPARVFAGRGGEEASIVADLASNSVALLGSRRIGKTSLMRRVQETLVAQGRTVYYGDCQAIGDWGGFARLARRKWHVTLDDVFDPDQLSELAAQLRVGDDTPVLILDEVDRLVDWDQNNTVAGVSEAFFRKLRGLSQERDAQFLFSGERTIADRLWAPASPHWNFCQRLSLRQLDRDAAASLLFGVLESLSVRFDDDQDADALLWLATSGHPRLVQLLGDRLVQQLNQRSGEDRGELSVDDLRAHVDSFDFKREYLETYWGQATPYERQLGQAVAAGRRTLRELHAVAKGDEDLGHALRVLDLYGIIDVAADEAVLRAEFMPEALETIGRERVTE